MANFVFGAVLFFWDMIENVEKSRYKLKSP